MLVLRACAGAWARGNLPHLHKLCTTLSVAYSGARRYEALTWALAAASAMAPPAAAGVQQAVRLLARLPEHAVAYGGALNAAARAYLLGQLATTPEAGANGREGGRREEGEEAQACRRVWQELAQPWEAAESALTSGNRTVWLDLQVRPPPLPCG